MNEVIEKPSDKISVIDKVRSEVKKEFEQNSPIDLRQACNEMNLSYNPYSLYLGSVLDDPVTSPTKLLMRKFRRSKYVIPAGDEAFVNRMPRRYAHQLIREFIFDAFKGVLED